MDQLKPLVWRNEKMNIGMCQNNYKLLAILEYHDYDAKIKVLQISIQ